MLSRHLPVLLLLWTVLAPRCLSAENPPPVVRSINDAVALPGKIAFGSCAKETKPQPVLDVVVANRPDLFIYLGDNIYADTRDMQVLQRKYAQLGSKPEFQRLRAAVPVPVDLGQDGSPCGADRVRVRTGKSAAAERNSSPAGAAATAWCRAKQQCGSGRYATPGSRLVSCQEPLYLD